MIDETMTILEALRGSGTSRVSRLYRKLRGRYLALRLHYNRRYLYKLSDTNQLLVKYFCRHSLPAYHEVEPGSRDNCLSCKAPIVVTGKERRLEL